MAPKVIVDSVKVINNTFRNGSKTWTVLSLIEASKDLEPFDLPLAGIDIGVPPWSDLNSMKDFAEHVKRVKETDLKYPVILSDSGYIADGWHRVIKALVLGKTTIKAVRLERMPYPDSEDCPKAT